jgi:transcriptional regulator with XRE-family HTH domain
LTISEQRKKKNMDLHGIKSYGERLHFAYTLRGFPKLYALSHRIGVTESALSRWFRSEPISLENFAKLCVELNVNADWLLLGRGEYTISAMHDAPHRKALADTIERMADTDVRNLAKFLVEVITPAP